LVDQAEYDKLAGALVNISTPAGRILPLIRVIVAAEFERNFRRPGSILRGNCVASKLMAAYSRKVGIDYLQAAVGETVKFITNSEVSFEINPIKIRGIQESQKNGVILSNQQNLRQAAEQFVKNITSDRLIEMMPREVCAIAGFTAEYARTYASDRLSPLVGGFLMLRLVNPTLVTPDAYGIVPRGSISATARRNLTLLSKVIQNLSNNIPFGSKEEYMTPMNSFIEKNADKMKQFFSQNHQRPQTTRRRRSRRCMARL